LFSFCGTPLTREDTNFRHRIVWVVAESWTAFQRRFQSEKWQIGQNTDAEGPGLVVVEFAHIPTAQHLTAVANDFEGANRAEMNKFLNK